MIWNAGRGGMRSVVEGYISDGFIDRENIYLINSYGDGGFLTRQIILLRALAVFSWCLIRHRIGLVHCHAAMRGSFWRKGLFASLARLRGVPVVLHLHGSEMKLFYRSQCPIVQKLIRRHLRKATRVIALSEGWKEFVESIAPGVRVVVLPNYVKVSDSVNAENRSAQTILFLGIVGPRKGTFDLIRAFHRIHESHPGAQLIVAGNGQIAEAEELVAHLKLNGRVIIAGWAGDEARAKLLEKASIFALPSYNEGLPMSVLEAMAAGLAVVTTRVGGIPELITDSVDGMLLEPGNPQKLADAIATLLDDAELCARIGNAGQKRVLDHYSRRIVLPALHNIYATVSVDRENLRMPKNNPR